MLLKLLVYELKERLLNIMGIMINQYLLLLNYDLLNKVFPLRMMLILFNSIIKLIMMVVM